MSGRPRVEKDTNRRLADCESHLRFLFEALAAYDKEPDRYKQIAAELRILVCRTQSNKPLLLDLMDELDVKYDVHPIPDLPFPITMVDNFDEPAEDLTDMTPEQIWEHHRSNAHSVPLREFVEGALAVFIRPHAFSHRDLILAVAQQIGSSHEDRTVEVALVQLEQFLIGGFSGYGAPLRVAAQHTLGAGAKLMRCAADAGLYTPRYLKA